MTRVKVPALLILTAVIIGILLRVNLAANKKTVTHDEIISYLVANGNMGAYEMVINGSPPGETWSSAADWKHFITHITPFAFRQISRDLAEYDIHPPLYFWLLHMWMLAVGIHPWTGATLNSILFLAGLLSLYGLAKNVLDDNLEAAVSAFIWAISPAVLTMSSQARHYELFGLSAVLFVWLLNRYTNPNHQPNRRSWLLLTLATALGALTHYHFALVVVGAGLLFLVKQWGIASRRFISGTAAILTGYVLMGLLHPGFLTSWQQLAQRQKLEARYLSTGIDILRRLYATVDTFTGFWIYGLLLQTILFILFITSLIWVISFYLKNRDRLQNRLQLVNRKGMEMLWLLLWIGGWTLLLYITFISPIHAMEPRHMAVVWPFYALLPVFLTRLWPHQQTRLLLIICGVVLVSGIVSTIQTIRTARQIPDNTTVLTAANNILIDTLERGIAPHLFWPIPDETAVFIAPQAKMPAIQSAWLDQLQDGDVYINDMSYENNINGRDQILDILAQHFELILLPGGVEGFGSIYLLREK